MEHINTNQTESIDIFSVSQLNSLAREILEQAIPLIWVSGEISNLARPSSGHLYFSLKDEKAQVRCALFRNSFRRISCEPENGMQVLVQARVSLYEGRGEFQLIIEHMEEAGDGKLQREFEKLKAQLQKEGLFALEHKKSLPTLPSCIGVVTSSTGAAVRDILSVLARRCPSIPVIIYPTQVQGADATPQIVRAIEKANARAECDVLIVARGGGSLEDLWCFNEEVVARAIYASDIPVVSGVGHEVDVTIADFVADQRAPTPTAAAELVSPDREQWLHKLSQLQTRLIQRMSSQLIHAKKDLMHLQKRLKDPSQYMREQAQRVDNLEHRLTTSMQYTLTKKQQSLANVARALDAISPLNTLHRGFSIAQKGDEILKNSKQVNIGDDIQIRLRQGKLDCRVTGVQETDDVTQ